MMAPRRRLTEGVKPVDRTAEEAFVYGTPMPDEPKAEVSAAEIRRPGRRIDRLPLTTRIRTDMAVALKRASLERQLAGEYPNELQEILEEALEPWLKKHGYLK
jgi:hypothetical protein